jgi:hypothetical protein
MMTALDQVAIAADSGFQRRWIISTPPQEGKTMRMGTAVPLWLLMRDPTRRIVVASYEQSVAGRSTMAVRQAIEIYGGGIKGDRHYVHQEDQLGLILDGDRFQQTNWALIDTPGRRNGGMNAVGVGGALTGRSADVLIIDDAVKGPQQAGSPQQRQLMWDWYLSVASTRLSPGAILIVIGCLTGDTPVLLADGTNRPIREIRPGDLVASFEDGRITTTRVLNWINHGPDALFSIRMKSGVEIRANARHPFLTIDENGEQAWRRTEELLPSVRILRAVAPTPESSARQTDATLRPNARACACPTTAKPDGLPGIDRRPLIPGHDVRPTSGTGTSSTTRFTTAYSASRVDVAPFAENRPALPTLGGTEPSSLITATTQEPCADCCATSATWPSDTDVPPSDSVPPPTTWTLEADEVVEVVPTLAEDVFDIQVERTENFIANGLVTHNTRWHEDDLIGRLIAQDEQSRKSDFHQLVIPAIAKSNDPLGRKPGEYLVSTRGRMPQDWDDIRRRVGEWVWAALYDADPHPPAGGVFQLAWIAYHRVPVAPELLRTEVFVDPADNEGDGDEAGIVTLARGVDEHFYLLADESGHMTVGQWFRRAFLAALRHDATAIRYERSLSQLRKSGRQAWKDIRRDALKLHELDPFKKMPGKRARVADEALIHVAARQLVRDDAEPEEILAMEKSLAALWPLVLKVIALPETGIPIRPITPKGTKTFRAQMVAPLHEYGKVHHVGLFPELQHQLVSWKEGLDSPDRMDAYVHGLTELSKTDAATANPAPARSVQPLPTRPSVGLGNTIRRQGESRRFR